jgi:hypothetical protein
MKLRVLFALGVVLAGSFLHAGFGFSDDGATIRPTAQIVEQVGDKGRVNWTDGYIEAGGYGTPPEKYIGRPNARPLALRAAKVEAYRNLLEITQGVRVTSLTMVKDLTVDNDTVRTQVDGVVRAAIVVKQDCSADDSCEITLRMPLSGNLAGVVIPVVLEKQRQTPPAIAPPAPPKSAPQPAPSEVYTGMVVDARGLNARPAMSPKILDEEGKEVYGTLNVDREYAIQQGMSGYARDLTAAQSNPRVTNNPASIKGLRTEGPGRSDIVISNADAGRIRGATDNLSFLKKCRVMIVLD